MLRRFLQTGFIGLWIVLLGGCLLSRPTSVPIPTIEYPATQPADTLVVLLPGIGNRAERFAQEGLVADLQQRWPTADVVAVDAHFGYYRQRSIPDRLAQDVFAARAGRYRSVWLVGASLGGLGSAIYAMQHAEQIDGVILLAPFLGNRKILRQVASAGGLASWQPPTQPPQDDAERLFSDIWAWLQPLAADPNRMPRLYLGYGDRDAGVATELLTEALPQDRVVVLPGGHKWRVWRPLLDTILARENAANQDQEQSLGGIDGSD